MKAKLLILLLLLTISLTSLISQSHFTSQSYLEKVYLHLDRSYYFAEDTIWYKAYLREGNSFTSDTLSRVLYVELINPENKVIERQKLLMNNGNGWGEFKLLENLPGGTYQIRAYTNWMRNNPVELFFHQTFYLLGKEEKLMVKTEPKIEKVNNGDSVFFNVQIFDTFNWDFTNESKNGKINFEAILDDKYRFKDSVSINDDGYCKLGLFVPDSLSNSSLAVQMHINNGIYQTNRKVNVDLNEKPDIQFFPEGGKMINRVKSKIGVKAVGVNNKPIQVSGVIKNDKNEECIAVKTNSVGMGLFSIVPNAENHYFFELNYEDVIYKYSLPNIYNKGVDLSVDCSERDTLKVILSQNCFNKSDSCYLVVKNKGIIKLAQPFCFNGNNRIIKIDPKVCNPGLSTVSIVDSNGETCAERLIFIEDEEKLNFQTKMETDSTNKRLTIQVKDKFGKPVKGHFSLSIINPQMVNSSMVGSTNMQASLYLTSELDSRIDKVNMYFDSTNIYRRKDLDAFLINQDFNQYSRNYKNKNKQSFIFPFEQGDVIQGKVFHQNPRKKYDNLKVLLMLMGKGKFGGYSETILPDSTGSFLFNLPPMYGNSTAYIQTDNKKDKKRDWSVYVEPDSFPVAYCFQRCDLDEMLDFSFVDIIKKSYQQQFMEKQINSMRHYNIDEITVVEKNKLPWYYSPAETEFNVDSLDPTGDKYENLFDFLSEQHKGHIEWTSRGDVFIMPVVSIGSSYGFPIFMINGSVVLDGAEDADLYFGSLPRVSCLNMNEISRIKIYEPSNSYSTYHANSEILSLGIRQTLVEIETYDLNYYRGNPMGVSILKLQGFHKSADFSVPDFSKMDNLWFIKRYKTLYWNPEIVTDENGYAELKISIPESLEKIVGKIEGFSNEGKMGESKFEITLN